MIWIMDKSTRHELIDRYFEGELSLDEERMLRSELLRLTDPDNIEHEALAVMSYSLLNADKRGGRKSRGQVKTSHSCDATDGSPIRPPRSLLRLS